VEGVHVAYAPERGEQEADEPVEPGTLRLAFHLHPLPFGTEERISYANRPTCDYALKLNGLDRNVPAHAKNVDV
jgi:hypothetical protein